jgi:steroid 5-alpha reductase family enzyme
MILPMGVEWFLTGFLLVSLMMFLLWLVGLRNNNYSIVDFGWAIGLALIADFYGWQSWRHGGYLPRILLFCSMATIWGLRLGLYLLLTRVVGHPEEGRYQQLRKEWKTNLPLKFLVFFLFQGLLDSVLSLPFLWAALNQAVKIHWLEIAGVVLFLSAKTGESIADAQLTAFKKDPNNKGKTCRRGLWNYSRHPNYFFEWNIWVAWFLFALASPHGWTAVLSPALMMYFLFKVTGIPATEEQSLRTKGDEYRDYQRTTSAFVPWFKKKETS